MYNFGEEEFARSFGGKSHPSAFERGVVVIPPLPRKQFDFKATLRSVRQVHQGPSNTSTQFAFVFKIITGNTNRIMASDYAECFCRGVSLPERQQCWEEMSSLLKAAGATDNLPETLASLLRQKELDIPLCGSAGWDEDGKWRILWSADEKVPGDSPIEKMFAVEWRKQTGQYPQAQVTLGAYRVDFLVGKLVIECDGHEHHSSKEDRGKDAKRDRELMLLGYQTVRFTGTEIHANVKACVEQACTLAAQTAPDEAVR